MIIFIAGFILGYFTGGYIVQKYSKPTRIIQITKENAQDIVDSKEVVDQLKKELKLK